MVGNKHILTETTIVAPGAVLEVLDADDQNRIIDRGHIVLH